MKKHLLPFLFLFISCGLSAQWVQQTAPNSNNYYSVFVINNNDVGIAGATGLLRSTNGGVTWAQQVTIGGTNFFELHTKDPSRWYSLSQNSSWFIKMLNPSGSVLNSGKPDSILSLNFATTGCASAVGTAGKIETTCDTGATWQVRSSGTSANLNAVWFADQDTGCAVGSNGVIRRTTDGGSTWSAVTPVNAFALNGIHFPTPSIGYAVGNNGTILKSTNAGKTWMAVASGTTTNLNGVFFTDKDSGYVVGYFGLIMKTYNGGAS
ncbi:MAG: WD40/YVTN/BNR-like repeat-containing protein, partial [Bacteroidia bacterium]